MNSNMTQTMLVCFVLSTLCSGAVFAQDAGVAPADRMKAAKAVQKLSSSDMKERAQSNIAKMKTVRQDVATLLKDSQEADDADIEKISCINSKLTSIKGFLNVSEQSSSKMATALEGPNTDRSTANHQFLLVDIAKTKIDNLGVEAQSCAGEILRYSGKTELGVQVNDNIAQIDPTALEALVDTLFRLPEATPYQ